MEEALVEARGRMIEAEHALFVALRLAGHEPAPQRASGAAPLVPGCVPFGPGRRTARPANVLPLFPRGKRAA